MTAIFGIYQRDNRPVPLELMQRAARSLQHHAVDGLDVWQEDPIALGQALTRFWNTSAHHPHPERDDPRSLVLVSDARLDNRAELADRLKIRILDLGNLTDSQLILRAYSIWEEDCPKFLLGDFVFALWDGRRKCLVAARDPMGIRWLYYATSSMRFSFASDPGGLLDLMDEPPRLDLAALDRFFLYKSHHLIHQTLFENVHKLPPAHILRVSAGKKDVEVWSYWQAEEVKPLTIRDPREGAEHLGILLKQAVTDRMNTPILVSSHLSGGLDSSAITALALHSARQHGRPDPVALSWSPPIEMLPLVEKDERVYVQRIAEYLKIPVGYTHVPPEVDVILETSDPSILPISTIRFEYTLMENARHLGARVLLSGWGGDEFAFSRGIGYPSGLIQRGRWLALARYLRYQFGRNPLHWVDGLYSFGFYPLFPTSWQMRLPNTLKWESDPVERRFQRSMRQNRFNLPAKAFFQPDFYSCLEKLHQPGFQWIPPGLHACQRWYLDILPVRVESWALWSARLGMRHAYPLLDRRIVEFALAMPEDWIYWQGRLRRFAFHAIADVLPAELLKGRDKEDRALFANQKTLEHKKEVQKGSLATLDAYRKTQPPASRWLDLDYLYRVLSEPVGNLDHPRQGEFLPREGIWEVLNFAFIDSRTILGDQ